MTEFLGQCEKNSLQNSCRSKHGLRWIFPGAQEWWWIIDMDEWCETKHFRKHWWYSIFQRSPTTDRFSTASTSLLKSSSLLFVPKVGWDLQGGRFNTRKAMQLVAWFPWWAWKVRGAGSQFDGRQCESSPGALSQGDNDGKWMWWVKSTCCILIVQIEVYIHMYNPNSLQYRVDLDELRQGEFHRFSMQLLL